MSGLPFIKMHGLGNDFVVLDGRREPLGIDAAKARAIADRRTGVGCDQVLVIEPPRDAAVNGAADAFMRIFNPDGGESGACGNGARCVAHLLMAETGTGRARIETAAAVLEARADEDGRIGVDMGPVNLDWKQIPLARAMDTLKLDFVMGPLAHPVAVNVGNPHAVFFVADADAVPLAALGPVIEHDPLFPERVNVGVATVKADGSIRLRVWERGAGMTLACGSGASAALVAASLRNLTGRRATVELDGGRLLIEWREDNHVVMAGPVATVFSGLIERALLDGSPR